MRNGPSVESPLRLEATWLGALLKVLVAVVVAYAIWAARNCYLWTITQRAPVVEHHVISTNDLSICCNTFEHNRFESSR